MNTYSPDIRRVNINADLDTIVAYRVGNHYTFEFPPDRSAHVGLAAVKLQEGAWLCRNELGETLICSDVYQHGARLMPALSLGLCKIADLELEEYDEDEAEVPHRSEVGR